MQVCIKTEYFWPQNTHLRTFFLSVQAYNVVAVFSFDSLLIIILSAVILVLGFCSGSSFAHQLIYSEYLSDDTEQKKYKYLSKLK